MEFIVDIFNVPICNALLEYHMNSMHESVYFLLKLTKFPSVVIYSR